MRPGPRRWFPVALAGALLAVLFIGQAGTAPRGEYAALEEELRRYIAGTDLEIHLFFEDLASGTAIGFRDRDPVPAGSTVKVPLALYLYHLAREGRVDLNERLSLTPEDFEGTDEEWQPDMRSFTLRQLAISSLQVSDNVATNALIRRLGRADFYAFMRDRGAIVLPTGPGDGNLTCARDTAAYLKALLVFQGKAGFGLEPLSFLYDTPFHDRLVAHLPWDLRVAHKVGTYQNVVADAGIFFIPGRPYVLSVFVRHPWRDEEDEKAAERAIAEISYLVYQHQTRVGGR